MKAVQELDTNKLLASGLVAVTSTLLLIAAVGAEMVMFTERIDPGFEVTRGLVRMVGVLAIAAALR